MACSYFVTGNEPVHQAIYSCLTCQQSESENLCCCSGCVENCHKGHEVSFIAFGDSYCDCGAGCCQLMKETIEKSGANDGIIFNKNIQKFRSINKIMHNVPHPKFNAFTLPSSDYNFQEMYRTLKIASKHLVEFTKETSWIGITDTPANIFEHFAVCIGNYHFERIKALIANHTDSNDIEIDPNLSGFEWWVQYRTHSSKSGEDEQAKKYGVDLHYDKDEQLASDYELGIFPLVSTVTYLTTVRDAKVGQAPTIVLEATASDPVGASIKKVYLSSVQEYKHVAFDGDLLHGAPMELLPLIRQISDATEVDDEEIRITFLVNIWINHHPHAVQRISPSIMERICEQLPQYRIVFSSDVRENLFKIQDQDITTMKLRGKDLENEDNIHGDWFQIPFVSDKSEWGISSDESALSLSIFLPFLSTENVKNILALNDKRTKNKRKRGHSQNDSLQSDLQVASNVNTSFCIEFMSDDIAPKLEYEVDEEAEEELNNAFFKI